MGASSGADEYRLRHDYYANNALVASPTVNVTPTGATPGRTGPEWQRSSRPPVRDLCARAVSLPTTASSSRTVPLAHSGTQLGRRTHTTIDRSKPAISVATAGGAAAVRNTLLPLHVGYVDDVSPPFPGNFLCVAPGADATAACGTAIFGFTPACSVPATSNKTTSFECQVETSGINPPDGPLWVCAIAADSSIPDNPSSANQSAPPTRPTSPTRPATRW